MGLQSSARKGVNLGLKGLNTIGSSLTFSVLFLLLCHFNIRFLFMALCLFTVNSVSYANKLG